jgi:hypothetical protein
MTPEQAKKKMMETTYLLLIVKIDAELGRKGGLYDLVPAMIVDELVVHYRELGWVTSKGSDWGDTGTVILTIKAPKGN